MQLSDYSSADELSELRPGMLMSEERNVVLEGDEEKARERTGSRAPVLFPGLLHTGERSTKREMETTVSALCTFRSEKRKARHT